MSDEPRVSARRPVVPPWLLAGAGLALALVAAPTLFAAAASAGRVLPEDGSVPAHDVAIIYGAEVYPSGTPSPFLAARLDVGVRLYRDGLARVLLVSGDNAAEHNRETSSMRAYLEARGVPARHIVEDAAGLDTYDTCVRAREVFGVTSALLVSQEYHLPRAVATCRAVGVDAVGVGDVSVRRVGTFWSTGANREFPANVKMALDLLTRRRPILEPPRSDVADALS